MKNVAVILPAYNSGPFLDFQIASILNQNGVKINLFLMDDGSDDGTQLKISRYAELNHNIHYVHSDSKFGNASKSFFHMLIELREELRNYDYIALSDHDDIWLPYKLLTGVSKLEGSGLGGYSSDFLSADYTLSGGFSNATVSRKITTSTGYDHYFEGPSAGCTYVLSVEFYSHLVDFISNQDVRRSLNTVFWHDWFIYMFALERNFGWVIDDRPHILYLQHGSNETGVNKGFKALKKRLKMLFSGWYFKQIISMLEIISPRSDITFRLKRLSFQDKLFFFKRTLNLRRKKIHAFLIIFFIIFKA